MEMTTETIGKIEQAAVRAAEFAVQRRVPYPSGSPSARVFLHTFAAAVCAQVIGAGEFARGGLAGNQEERSTGLHISTAEIDEAAVRQQLRRQLQVDPELRRMVRELVEADSPMRTVSELSAEHGIPPQDGDQVVSDEVPTDPTVALPEAVVVVVGEDGAREVVDGTVEQITPEVDAAAGADDETPAETASSDSAPPEGPPNTLVTEDGSPVPDAN